jgi:hypothetical protein
VLQAVAMNLTKAMTNRQPAAWAKLTGTVKMMVARPPINPQQKKKGKVPSLVALQRSGSQFQPVAAYPLQEARVSLIRAPTLSLSPSVINIHH